MTSSQFQMMQLQETERANREAEAIKRQQNAISEAELGRKLAADRYANLQKQLEYETAARDAAITRSPLEAIANSWDGLNLQSISRTMGTLGSLLRQGGKDVSQAVGVIGDIAALA